MGSATIDDVVLAFLQAEIKSERGPYIVQAIEALRYDRSALIDKPDLSDAHANCARAVILGSYRGFAVTNFCLRGFQAT